MAGTATPTRTDPLKPLMEKLSRIEDGYTKQQTAIEGLLKAAKTPASAAGLSPQQFLARSTAHGNPTIFTPDGTPSLVRYDPHGRRLGTVRAADGTEKNFGDFLEKFHDFNKSDNYEYRMKSRKILGEQYGVQGIGVDNAGMIVKTALAESSGVNAGYTVPPEFVAQLMMLAIEDSIVQPRAMKIPMSSRSLQIPVLDQVTAQGAGNSNFLAGVIATWTAEAATRTESEPIFRQEELVAWELSFYTVASNVLLQDSAIGMDALLTQLFSKAIPWYTDFAYIQGNGVGKPLGVLNAPATLLVGRGAPGRFQFADYANMLAKLYWMLSAGGEVVWLIHQSTIPQLIQMVDPAGRPVFIPLDQGAQWKPDKSGGTMSIGRLGGFPVLVTEKVPALGTTGDVMLIDWSKYILGQRMELQIDLSTQVRFLQNQSVWRCVWRGDGRPWLQGPVILADGVSKVSCFVALQ